MSMLNLSYDEDYKWENLSQGQKEALIDVYTTVALWIMLGGGAMFMFGTASDDDSWKKITSRIINDFSQQYNFKELTKNLTQNLAPVSARKYYKALEGFTSFFFSFTLYHASGNEDWLTREGNYKGAAELLRSFPFLSSYRDLHMFFENDRTLNVRDYIFTKGIN